MAKNMVLNIDKDVLDKIFAYAKAAQIHKKSEIAGWGHYGGPNAGVYALAPLLKQYASGAEVETFPDAILHDTEYDISDMIVQWHSHVDMRVFWSKTDEECIEEALGLFPQLFSIVVNVRGEYKARLDIGKIKTASGYIPLDKQITIECDLSVYNDDALVKEVMKDVKKKLVDKPAPKFANTSKYQVWDNTTQSWYSHEEHRILMKGRRHYVEHKHVPNNGNGKPKLLHESVSVKNANSIKELTDTMREFYTDDDMKELRKMVAILVYMKNNPNEYNMEHQYIYHTHTGMYYKEMYESSGNIGFYMQGIFVECDALIGKMGIPDKDIKEISSKYRDDDILEYILDMSTAHTYV
jgi:hypothetical protein